MVRWKDIKDLASKLADHIKGEPVLSFVLLLIIVLAFVGGLILPGYRTLLIIVVIGALLYSFVKLLLPAVTEWRKLALQMKAEPEAPQAASSQPSAATEPKPPSTEARSPRQKYLDAVIADCRPLRLAGLDEHAGDPQSARLSLEDVYIALNTTTTVEVKEDEPAKKGKKKAEAELGGREKTRPLPVLEALAQAPERRMALVGFPGTGKSTFVRYLALRMAQELRGGERKLDWPSQALLPVAVSLGRFAESLPAGARRGEASMLERFLLDSLQSDARMADFAPHLLPTLREDGGLLLFDGLDEVADLKLRPLVVQAVEDFTSQYGRAHAASRFLVTCRTYSYTDTRWQLTAWPKYELALLDSGQIEGFVNAWYEQHTRLDEGRAHTYAEKRQKLLSALRPDDRRRLYEVAPYPIILTVMAVVHASYELPDSRAQVYERCVDLLLEKWQTQRALAETTERRSLLEELHVPRATLDPALREVAFKAHQGRSGGRKGGGDDSAQVTESLLTGVLYDHLQDLKKVEIFLEYCQSANGLLMLQGTVTPRQAAAGTPPRRVYTFPHLTFEEYLAARHLAEGGAEEQACDLLRQGFDRWREVFMLLGEHLCFAQSAQGRMNGLLDTLAPRPLPEPMTDADWRALWLSGDLLTLYKRVFLKASHSEAHILANLHRLVQTGALELRERAAAADTLDALGHLPEDLYQLVRIPVGATHTLPEDASSGASALADAALASPGVSPLPVEFCIARYPITNAQYERFLNAADHDDEKYWIDLPAFGCPDEKYNRLESVDGRRYRREQPRFWDDPVFGLARRGVPVVGVTWYEASAFCRWLQANWDQPACAEWKSANADLDLRGMHIRLPTEAEWAHAGGGEEPKNRFPWDEPGQATQEQAEILRRANVFESGIGRTTPVDMYPLGASQPYGLRDMAGNVWEWQANYYDKDHDFLGLRGGSWYDPRGRARLPARNYYPPAYAWASYGFRVVVAPSLF